jgi:methionine-rich copper-binding protein CopC
MRDVVCTLTVALAIGASLALLGTDGALADTRIVWFEPERDSAVPEPPLLARIALDEPVEGKVLEVYDERGDRADMGDAWVEGPTGPGEVDVPHEAVYTVWLDQERMTEGTYTVEYGVISSDGHYVGGNYEFEVEGVQEDDPFGSQDAPGEEVKEVERPARRSETPVYLAFSGITLGCLAVVALSILMHRRRS